MPLHYLIHVFHLAIPHFAFLGRLQIQQFFSLNVKFYI